MKILFLLALALMCPGDGSDANGLGNEEDRDQPNKVVVPAKKKSFPFDQILQRVREKQETKSLEVLEVFQEEQNRDFEKGHRRIPSTASLPDVRA